MVNVMSVCHYPVYGGPHNRNALVAKLLEPEGFRTVVVLPDEPGNAADRLSQLDVGTVVMPLHRLRKSLDLRVHLDLPGRFWHEVQALRRLIRERSIDVVLLNGLVNPHAALAGRLESIGVVWQLLDTFPPVALRAAIMPFVKRWADVIMTNGMSVAAAHPGAMEFEGPLISFGPCVDPGLFSYREEAASAARQELGLEPDSIVIGNVSNLNPMKGHDTFVRAAGRLRKIYSNTQFVILGATYSDKSTYLDSIWRLAASAGLLAGKALIIRDPGPRVSELVQALDVFWLTSEPHSEGMSNVLAEAMALGIPVVTTRAGAVHECVQDGVTGYVVPPHDVRAIAKMTALLLGDPELRKRMGTAGAELVRTRFAPGDVAARHAEAYLSAISSAARRGHHQARDT